MNIHFKVSDNNRAQWHFNNRLLSNEDLMEFISKQIDFFLSVNKTPDVSTLVVWETLKAYIRGEIISYSGYERKIKREKHIELTKCIAQLDTIYATSPSPDLYKECLSLQAEFEVLVTDHTTNATEFQIYLLQAWGQGQQIASLSTATDIIISPNSNIFGLNN